MSTDAGYRLDGIIDSNRSGEKDVAILVRTSGGDPGPKITRRVSHWYRIRDAINDYLDEYEAERYGA